MVQTLMFIKLYNEDDRIEYSMGVDYSIHVGNGKRIKNFIREMPRGENTWLA